LKEIPIIYKLIYVFQKLIKPLFRGHLGLLNGILLSKIGCFLVVLKAKRTARVQIGSVFSFIEAKNILFPLIPKRETIHSIY